MSKIKFLFFSALHDLTKTQTLQLDLTGTVQDALNQIFELFGDTLKSRLIDPETGQIKRYVIIALNRKDIRHIQGLETPLTEGDEISILPAAAGG
ncbi:MAG: MoaD family protein [Candidatus Helarchaeota archaeon]